MPRSPIDSDEVFVVRGGSPLHGVIDVPGAKNSALKLMAAAILTPETVSLRNVPEIADVPVMAEVLRGLGAEVTLEGPRCDLRFAQRPDPHPPPDAVTQIRASISVLGALVARAGRARLAMPGGDRIGARSIDMHLRGLGDLGASVEQRPDEVLVTADRLHGADLTLEFPSVGATENLLMASVLAEGRTTIENAAREPEIQDLCDMLNAMGARIEGIGSPTLTVTGVDGLSGVTWATRPDRIEAGTWLVAAAVTGGEVEIRGVRPDDLRMPLLKLRDAGVEIDADDDEVLRVRSAALRPTNFVTLPYPGFPTDMQPQMMVLLTQADGTSMCTENVFESRFSFVEQLTSMGADIEIDGHHALIRGASRLRGRTMQAQDVRAGAGAVLAGLVADGETVVTDVHHIDRGYAHFVPRLSSLGADIERVHASEAPASA